MSLATIRWNDANRFNQTGYSACTLFPIESDYTNIAAFTQDYKAAERREESHQEHLDELRQEAREEAYYEQHEYDEE